MYMLALDALHGCKTAITITVSTDPANGAALVGMLSVWDVLPGSAELLQVVTERLITANELRNLPAVVYNGLYAHDFSIGEAYQQRGFKVPEAS
jgi:hypothetical protein